MVVWQSCRKKGFSLSGPSRLGVRHHAPPLRRLRALVLVAREARGVARGGIGGLGVTLQHGRLLDGGIDVGLALDEAVVVTVPMQVGGIAVAVVKTRLAGHRRPLRVALVAAADAPLADVPRGVTRRLHHRGQRHVRVDGRVEGVVAQIAVALVLARHQRGAGRGAHRRRGAMIREARALGRHAVQVRRMDARQTVLPPVLPETPQVAPAQVVAEHQDDVRARPDAGQAEGIHRRHGGRRHAGVLRPRQGRQRRRAKAPQKVTSLHCRVPFVMRRSVSCRARHSAVFAISSSSETGRRPLTSTPAL